MTQVESIIENQRLKIGRATDKSIKSSEGQYFTPVSIARYMASLFTCNGNIKLLDPGAGIGVLSGIFTDKLSGNTEYDLHITAFEKDSNLIDELQRTLTLGNAQNVSTQIINADFIDSVYLDVVMGIEKYTHVIMNPPYKKINKSSQERKQLSSAGLETVNLYTGFVALALSLLKPGGELVAIIPRSFSNGPYYKPFREYILARSAINHLHIFKFRNKAFAGDDVLQENLIIKLTKGQKQGSVTVSTSSDGTFSDYIENQHVPSEIIGSRIKGQFITIPDLNIDTTDKYPQIKYSLTDLGVKVSTGPVVDFRIKEDLCKGVEDNSVPLLYPAHMATGELRWPLHPIKKYNAIRLSDSSRKLLYNAGNYCLVKRFSAKEEKRRVVATVLNKDQIDKYEFVGFENHFNVFHQNKKGLPIELATGLAAYLNTKLVDDTFRQFNGHTQVNATDLRMLQYPSADVLNQIGRSILQSDRTPENIETLVIEKLTYAP
ncbi:MAG: Eco57I restriction-modification methylase domain-containing protein [Balneolales bacterium]|nr:Eco57I restriction-modification methylase domain-containing protein [Balneolales bacterium]